MKMIGLKYSRQSPIKPPKIIVQGPPGSGRSTQAKLLAENYGLIHISTEDLLKKLSKEQPDLGKIISQCYKVGAPVPDYIINSLIEQRLKQSDCRVNGWVLEGFPETEAQCNLIKAMNVNPSVVFIFDQKDEESLQKLSKRRIDPKTGHLYNLSLLRLKDKHLCKLLIQAEGDPTQLAQIGFRNITPEVQEVLKKDSPDASPCTVDLIQRLVPCEEDTANLIYQKYQNWKVSSAVLEDHFQPSVKVYEIIDVGNHEVSHIFKLLEVSLKSVFS